MNELLNDLKSIIKNPQCELNFTNNYELLCAVMLSAQTTDKRVNMVSVKLFEKYDNVLKLKNAKFEDVEEIIKPLGLSKMKTNNLLKLANYICDNCNMEIPNTLDELVKIPGVGRKTASVVLALGFNIAAFPVDTHVHRIAIRLGLCNEDDNVVVCEEKLKKLFKESDWILAHHLMLLFGRYHCKAIKPDCDNCIMKKYCIRYR